MKHISLLFLFSLSALLSTAQLSKRVTITAGGLSNELSDAEKNTLTSIVVNGTIDARDFRTLRDQMPLLSEIDLSGSTILKYEGEDGTISMQNSYEENTIPVSAFEDCENLTAVKMPLSVSCIDKYAFYATNLTSTLIPEGVKSILYCAFYRCDSMKTVSLPSSLKLIGECAFEFCERLTSITLPPSLETIESQAFHGCSMLNEVTIPASVANLGAEIFDGCVGLKHAILENGVSSVANFMFSYCDSLVSVSIPQSVSEIGKGAFEGCFNLTSIELPSKVNSIGSRAFNDCKKLNAIYSFPSSPVILSSSFDVFYGVDSKTCKLFVPATALNEYKSSDQWSKFSNIIEIELLSSIQYISLSANQINADSITITSNLPEWTATVDQSWLSISINGGKGNGSIAIKAANNTSSHERQSKISLIAGGQTFQTIVVSQQPALSNGISSSSQGLIQLYPNPVSEGFFIRGIENKTLIRITDLNGKVLLSKKVYSNEFIRIDSFVKGVYILNATVGNKTFQETLIKN